MREFVKKLHRKLADDPADPAWILNERGLGYRMWEPGEARMLLSEEPFRPAFGLRRNLAIVASLEAVTRRVPDPQATSCICNPSAITALPHCGPSNAWPAPCHRPVSANRVLLEVLRSETLPGQR